MLNKPISELKRLVCNEGFNSTLEFVKASVNKQVFHPRALAKALRTRIDGYSIGRNSNRTIEPFLSVTR
jgi:hypothetical protein